MVKCGKIIRGERMTNAIMGKKKELLKLPTGYLVLRNGCYYHRVNGKDTGITKNKLLIRKLARKQYLEKEIPILEKNEKIFFHNSIFSIIHNSPRLFEYGKYSTNNLKHLNFLPNFPSPT